jgi:hypothetical protein
MIATAASRLLTDAPTLLRAQNRERKATGTYSGLLMTATKG